MPQPEGVQKRRTRVLLFFFVPWARTLGTPPFRLMLDAVRNSDKPLTHERLFNWHAALFPTGRSGMYKINVAAYREGTEPMQVVSGAMGRERVHYEAPTSEAVLAMMNDFSPWIK